MKRRMLLVSVVLVLFLLASCAAALQQGWNSRTPDEQARIIVGGLQDTLDAKFDEAKAFVAVNPQHQNLWKKNIIPAFDKANKTLKGTAELAQQSKISPADVYAKYKPDIDALMLYLVQIGLEKKGGGK